MKSKASYCRPKSEASGCNYIIDKVCIRARRGETGINGDASTSSTWPVEYTHAIERVTESTLSTSIYISTSLNRLRIRNYNNNEYTLKYINCKEIPFWI